MSSRKHVFIGSTLFMAAIGASSLAVAGDGNPFDQLIAILSAPLTVYVESTAVPVNVSVLGGTVGIDASANDVDVTGTVDIGNTVDVTGDVGVSGTVDIGNTVQVAGDVGVSGTVDIGNTVDVTGTVSVETNGTPLQVVQVSPDRFRVYEGEVDADTVAGFENESDRLMIIDTVNVFAVDISADRAAYVATRVYEGSIPINSGMHVFPLRRMDVDQTGTSYREPVAAYHANTQIIVEPGDRVSMGLYGASTNGDPDAELTFSLSGHWE